MNREEIKEHLNLMRRQEGATYCCSDYLQGQRARPNSDGTIDALCRLKMTQWSYQVIDYIKFRRETVSIAMNYLDRFLSSGCARAKKVMTCRKEYQLASMTCLFIAIKINEPVMIDMTLLTDLSKGIYTPSDFSRMETDILFGLNWLVNGPTAQSFAIHFITLIQDHISNTSYDYQRLLELVSYQIELAVGEYKIMTEKPSVVAAASIWNNIEDTCPNETFLRQFHEAALLSMSIQLEDIIEVKEHLHELKVGASMQMRPSSLVLIQHSPRSTSLTPSEGKSQDIPCRKEHKQHSPICVSRRKLQIKR